MTRWLLTACVFVNVASSASAQNPAGETATPVRPRYAALAPVYFAFNSAQLSDSARTALAAVVEILKVNPAAEIIVVGHTDERGSYQVNQRFGQLRAGAVVSFLMQNGVSAARLETVSAGETQPAARGHDEAAWARNRRVEFRVRNNTPLRLPPPR